ncbi:hypothetical protein SCLCIDRAFT_1225417 [Scleroderma citrinum Foug A]|uniref:Secreted protein n=1 Tax=Scleroderma citrinum Foug A TaxID=1036808 RepID=A0A0C3CP02_9AGAM|nr:hypothetical protein SCLCIDRAFT_1225417 [Scleroderma citrinum Foug A]
MHTRTACLPPLLVSFFSLLPAFCIPAMQPSRQYARTRPLCTHTRLCIHHPAQPPARTRTP